MYHRRPPERRLGPSWSINAILDKLAKPPYELIHNAPLDLLTYKALFLVSTASTRRQASLHALSLQAGLMRFDPSGVHLLPDPRLLAKNQSLSFMLGEIWLPKLSLPEDRLRCPARALKWYIERTKAIHTSDQLFLLPRRPFTLASKETLSQWIVSLIRPHVSASDRVRAHDVCGYAACTAWFRNIPLEDILTAAWKTPSCFVSCYLTNTPTADEAFARLVLQPLTA